MKQLSFFSIILQIIPLALVMILAGCGSSPKPKAYNIKLSLDESLQDSTIQVDIIGFNKGNLPRYKSYSVTDYFGNPDDSTRKASRKKQFIFGQGHSGEQILLSDDPIWKNWLVSENAFYLVILADLPGIIEDQDSQSDPRRLIIPLDKNSWEDSTKMIDVVISEINLYTLQRFEDENL